MTNSLPSPSVPLIDTETGQITDVWYRYLSKTLASLTSLESVTPLTSITYATQADEEAGTSTVAVVTPSVQHYHPSAAKAWGVVTLTGTVATVDAGYNVNAAASTATGLLRVDLATAFSSTVYAVLANIRALDSTAVNRSVVVATSIGLATTTFTLLAQAADGVNVATDAYYFACYGDQ